MFFFFQYGFVIVQSKNLLCKVLLLQVQTVLRQFYQRVQIIIFGDLKRTQQQNELLTGASQH
jgi:hypothetical protein